MVKVKCLFLGIGLLVGTGVFAQNIITIDATAAKTTINKNIYGHFAEHLGRCIYDGFYVGEANKTIPNTDGVRNDIIAALKKLKIPNLRWPGGCFADTYHWKDGVGPKDKRPSIVNTNWGYVTEDNSFGTNDFLNMCELLGTEPYLSGNVGTGTVQEMLDWMQYTNFDSKSPMSDMRRQNGRDKPWNVKYWGIGNETYGCGGHMTAEYYAGMYRQYVSFMRNDGKNNLSFVAAGAKNDDYHWTETLMKGVPLYMLDGIAMHHYSYVDWEKKGSASVFNETQYFKTMKQAVWMEELVARHSAIMNKYDPKKKVGLVVDEWGGWYDVEPNTNPGFLYQQNTMRDAMIAGVTLNVFNNHADRVRMANLAQCVNVLQAVILTDKEKMILTPSYHVMEMYNVHQNAKLLPLTIQTNKYVLGDGKLPAVSASASIDANLAAHISLVNIDAKKTQKTTVNLKGRKFSTVTGRILTSKRVQDCNSFEEPDKVQPVIFKDVSLNGSMLTVSLPPFSLVVLELK
ncbi:alpha-N-arabinofuranosidase [Pedobacter westerhofensis]|uniref:non-reducing end alpha-L-arabinofuranosidase n=1 Tax=Pedobacter westerhofensis TaxID=425512 RepID=A0A521E0K1_9SPHI|nr:alpha-L-arabinofuranosidase C-terminal domain-containing protein [Pedobacter westerhofensis]SMO76660.1 alpha-N-arabinofuranosidase [Pedobacter westerhofensis]